MAKRPTHLVMVNHGATGIELFSAHHNHEDAQRMHDRLVSLLRATTSQAYLIEVPTAAGVTEQKFTPTVKPTDEQLVEPPDINGKGAPEEAEDQEYGRWV